MLWAGKGLMTKILERTEFKGDSLGKKVIRNAMWMATQRYMRVMRQPFKGALVLAGGGGDVSTMAGLGMDPSKVYNVDIARNALQKTQDKCADLGLKSNFILGGVGDAALSNEDTQYNVAHMDWNGGLAKQDHIEGIFRAVIGASSWPMILNISVLKGREFHSPEMMPHASVEDRTKWAKEFREIGQHIAAKVCETGIIDSNSFLSIAQQEMTLERCQDLKFEEHLKKLEESRRSRDLKSIPNPRQIWDGHAWQDISLAQELLNVLSAPSDLTKRRLSIKGFRSGVKKRDLSGIKANGQATQMGHALKRAKIVKEVLNALLRPYDLMCMVLDVYAYHSGEPKGSQVYRDSKKDKGSPFSAFTLMVQPVGSITNATIFSVAHAVQRQFHNPLTWVDIPMKLGWAVARQHAIECSNLYSLKDAGMIFNVPPGTIGSWRAHQSMGSYDSDLKLLKRRGLLLNVPKTKRRTAPCRLGWGHIFDPELVSDKYGNLILGTTLYQHAHFE
jgi:hypothetical protein